MSIHDWESDNFNTDHTNKWNDEDQGDIKDDWDKTSSESDSENVSTTIVNVQRKKKKKLCDIIMEKENARQEALAAKKAEEEAAKVASLPAAVAAEKKRLQKMDEECSLQLAKEMMGVDISSDDTTDLSSINQEKLDQIENEISGKVDSVIAACSAEMSLNFIESLIARICLNLNVSTLKRVKLQVEALHSTKLKEGKSTKSKKSKGFSVKMDLDKDRRYDADYGDVMDDFM